MKHAFAAMALTMVAWGAALASDPTLLLRVERKTPDDLVLLRTGGVPVVMETLPCLFVLGGEADLAALRERGYDARVLDRAPASADYLIVGVRPDSDVAAVRSAGAVLLEEENWILVRVPAGSSFHALEAAKVFIGRMPKEPAGIPKPPPEAAQRHGLLLPNPIVQKIVTGVSNADIQTYWQALVSNVPTGTRFSTAQGCRDAATYCFNAYTALKVAAQYQNWNVANAPNVIGTLEGATRPGDVYIVEAHLDDLPSSGVAPGADDNASGSAAVLESAKALSCWGIRNTVKFLNVTGEESGLLGSNAYAADAATRGENIRGVINFDMIGWAGDGLPSPENLDLNYNTSSQWLAQRFVGAAATYGTGLAVNAILCPSLNVSDHYPFWQRGWSAVCGITDNEDYCGAAGNYPYYHTANDTIANNGSTAFYYKVVKATVATLAELADPFKLTFSANAYACGSPLQVLLADRDLNTGGGTTQTVVVLVTSTSEPAGESLTLTERGMNSMIFDGTLPTTSAPPVAGDGVLTVAAGDTVSVQYVDALDCNGATNVTYTATAGTDCVAPVISGVGASAVTGNSASIGWTTDEAATSVVHYGTAPPAFATASSSSLVTTHAVGLAGLAECSPYAYWVESADGVGNNASDNAGGAYYAFTTGKNTTPSYVSTDTPIAIPDNNTAGITSTIPVPDDKIVEDVNVTVNVTHTFDGDLTISLVPPVGAPIALSSRRGGSGDNFVGTIFDDAATTPIASGTAPFTGSFKPDSPLGAANGIHSVGAWKLKVVDGGSADVGSLNNWTLTLTYPAAQCGPHAAYTSESLVRDTCSAGGAGSANGTWDPGEQVQFKVRVTNDGTAPLTGLTATVTSTTPGVVMMDGVADFADLAAGASGDSIAPHVTAKFPSSLACGALVAFDVSIQSAQGTWTGAFTQAVGLTLPGGGTALNETFTAGIPVSWTIVDGGTGSGAAATWTAANPGGRTFTSPLVAPVATVDSDNAGAGVTQDEQLITPVMNLASATTVALDFDQYFRYYTSGQAELGDVDVRSSLTGDAWVNVFRNQGASSANPDHKTLSITAQAAGAANVQVRFHYYQATFEYYWQVDNVKVTYAAPGGCQSNVCLAPPPPPPPVPDGTFGTPMRSDRAAADGSSIALHWDVATCTALGYKVLHGSLANVASTTVDGAACAMGTSGSATWSGVPGGDLWYVVVATDGSGTEGAWGAGGGSAASGLCGDTSRNDAGTCP
jgi:subtilisin-like proprotein convertase family protein